ncbi:hypothetical protein ACSFA3_20845 [Variovorax sp. RHLX14]|uniref:hypothetical protein n=1 Tax=Variovorax sp. RHLX14 TaxID=1259731 RepID=UPI003F458945
MTPSRADVFLAADVAVAGLAVDEPPVKQQSLWMVLSKKTIGDWWSKRPLNLALQIVQPALRLYARKNPAVIIAVGAGTGALIYLLRPWRLLSLSSLAAVLIRTPAIPKLAMQLVHSAQKNDVRLNPKDAESAMHN